MNIDIKKIKQELTLEDYEEIITSLGIPITSKNGRTWSLKGYCHSLDNTCGSNLKFFTDTFTFTCFSHNCIVAGDIIELVEIIKELEFVDALNYIIDELDLSTEYIKNNQLRKDNFSWNSFFNKYIKHEISIEEIKKYDDKILCFFDKIYHQSFINDNISIPTMEKFEICYYASNQQIVIPVRDENMELVGIHARNLIPDKIEIGLKYQPVKMLNGYEYKFPTSAVLYGLGQNKNNIIKTKTVRIFESPKAVMQMEDILKFNNSVGLFGINMSKYKRQLLINLGIENVEICLDKQYETIGDEKYIVWEKCVNKLITMFVGYCNIVVVYDKDNLLNYKDSPSDKGKIVWDNLSRMQVDQNLSI